MSDSKSITATPRVYLLTVLAFAVGLVFNYLFFDKLPGVSVVIFVAIVIALTLWLCQRHGMSYRAGLWLMGGALVFSLCVMVRDNGFLSFLNILATLGLLLLAIRSVMRERVIDFRLPDYLKTIFWLPFKILRRSLEAISLLFRPGQNSPAGRRTSVIKGIVMALPFLVIFGLLFASADAAFKQFFTSIFTFTIPDTVFGHLVFIVGPFVISLGVWALLFINSATKKSAPITESTTSLPVGSRSLETSIFLWLIAALFLVFIIFQVAYLFGGAANITAAGFTYAEYARRGFWELLIVAFITLLLLLVTDFYTQRSLPRLKWFTLPSLVLIGEIFIIMTSSFKRLMLYQSAYGLTTLRLYVAGFIIFLAVIFALLALKLWREKRDSFFALGALLAMIAFLLSFNLLNPDNFITRQNVARFGQTGAIDMEYLASLRSADAVPALLDVYGRLPKEVQEPLFGSLEMITQRLEKDATHWESFNISRRAALIQLREEFKKQ